MTTTQKGAAAGTGIGAALGAGIGALTGNAGMGAAIGAGTGAVGGALMGDYIDSKREQDEKAQMNRQLEMERKVPVKSEYQKELDAQLSEESSYSTINEKKEDLFKREWEHDHWVYTPTNNPNETNLFRRVKDDNGYWMFISIDKKEFGVYEDKPISSQPKSRNDLNSGMNVQPQTSISENQRIEKARKELEQELETIRKERKQ